MTFNLLISCKIGLGSGSGYLLKAASRRYLAEYLLSYCFRFLRWYGYCMLETPAQRPSDLVRDNAVMTERTPQGNLAGASSRPVGREHLLLLKGDLQHLVPGL